MDPILNLGSPVHGLLKYGDFASTLGSLERSQLRFNSLAFFKAISNPFLFRI